MSTMEEDILEACRRLIAKARDIVTFAGKIQAYDAATNTVTFIVDGANAGIPCLPLDNIMPTVGMRGVVIRVLDTHYLIGRLGNKVISLPDYTGSHPTNTQAGDMWLRSDLGHAYVNIAGTPTQLT